MRDRSTYLLRDPWFSISLRSLQPPCSASPHSPQRHSTDRPSDRSGTQSPSALNTKRSDSHDMAQDKYAGNQQIRANVPSPSPRGGHDAIRGEKRARRRGDGNELKARGQRQGARGTEEPVATKFSLLLESNSVDKACQARDTRQWASRDLIIYSCGRWQKIWR